MLFAIEVNAQSGLLVREEKAPVGVVRTGFLPTLKKKSGTRPVLADKAGSLPAGVSEADSLLELASKEVLNVNPSQTLELATQALSLSRETDYPKGRMRSCLLIGQSLIYMGDYEKSLEYLTLSEQEAYRAGDRVVHTNIHRIKGQVYFNLGLKNASFREFQKSLDLAVRIDDKAERDRYVSMAYENLAIAYDIMKEDPDSSRYYMKKNEQLLATTDESRTFTNKINLFTLIGGHYCDRQQYDSAVSYFNKALSLITAYDFPYSSYLYRHWGDLHALRGDRDSALCCYRKGLENVRETNLKNELPGLYQKLSDTFSGLGMEDSARFYNARYLQVNSEFSVAQNEAAEKAMQILLDEEQGYARDKHRKTIAVIAGIVIAVGLAATLSWERLRKRKNKMLSSQEEEISDLKLRMNDAFDEVMALARNNETAFLPRFREVYPEFTEALLEKYPDIINTELQFCAMIFLNFTSKEIAQYMYVTHRSVQTRKSRLRKRLHIPGDTDLYQYFKNLR